MSKEFQHQIEQAAKQRAALMGLIVSILKDEADLTHNEIKQKIVSSFALIIDMDCMVHDEIDLETGHACRDFLLQQMAVKSVNDMLS